MDAGVPDAEVARVERLISTFVLGFARPGNRGPRHGLYLVGGSVHPGGGLPVNHFMAQEAVKATVRPGRGRISCTVITVVFLQPSGGDVTELSHRRRMLVLLICCMSLLIVGLDNTIVNVALPALERDLHAPLSGLQWTIDAYTLVLASLLMLSGSTGDRIGRRRTFQIGLVAFAAGSLLCGLAPTLGWLVAFRILQAIGGSMLNPVAMSIITNTFTDPRERARAIGVWGGVIGISMALGPVVGGTLVDSVGWRAIFWINVPVALAALLLTALFVPESRAPRPRRVDPVGQVLVIVMLASLTYAIIEAPSKGWGSPVIVGFSAAAVAALIGLLLYEPRRRDPLIDLRFFRSAPFSGAAIIAISAFAGLGGFLFLNTLYLQDVRGMSPLHAGLCTLPIAAMTLVFAPLSGRLVGDRGPRPSLVMAGIAITASGLMLTRITPDTPLPWLLASYTVFGLGLAMVNAPITNTAVSGMPRAQAGVAAAVASTSRQIGQSLGVAVAGAALAWSAAGSLHDGFTGASRPAWWITVGYGTVVLLLGIITTGRWAKGTADRTAARLTAEDTRIPVAI
ncbi:EmrB/QacA subfamily drug resistance transporter [Streptosporangium album]|uniref:EmrB/QacA subfamily drug resistance transporter n=1 Tax=Streptosporangium album TaxID=47479 RepID=A0A7W7S5N1_9ACTN|nr:MFS transporter [Streptosporangium album]MBB4944359.1 EmrB/QacA subfamily drug resistance transporter [Streptosporangium album]